jgi:hypothetical protein
MGQTRQLIQRIFNTGAIAQRARRAKWAEQDRRKARINWALTALGFAVLLAGAYWMLPECDPLSRTTYCRN